MRRRWSIRCKTAASPVPPSTFTTPSHCPPTTPRALPNTLLTPHSGYVTAENLTLMYTQVVEDIAAWLDGAPLRVLNGWGESGRRRKPENRTNAASATGFLESVRTVWQVVYRRAMQSWRPGEPLARNDRFEAGVPFAVQHDQHTP